MINTDKKHFTHEELKKALKDFKTTKLDETDLKVIVHIHPSFYLSIIFWLFLIPCKPACLISHMYTCTH